MTATRATLLALAERVEAAMVLAAESTTIKDPWYKDERRDMAHAANCATVAAACRAIAGSMADG